MAKNTKPEAIQLTCDICSENYTDPLMLTCLHSFCKKCLIKRKEEQGASDGCLKCPTCNTSTRLTDRKVEGLTQNCWLAHQVKVASLKDKMSGEKEVPCDDCVDDSPAVSYCCECSIFLCSFCQKSHQKRRETIRHKLIEIGTNKPHDKMPHVPHKPMYCSQHTDEKLKFYCHTCQILVCRDCILVDHKDHKYGDFVKVSDSSKVELKQCLANCNKVIDTANDALANGNKILQLIEKREGEVNKEIVEVFDKLQAILESRRKALLNQSKEIANKKRKGVKNQLEAFEKLKKEVCYASQLTVAVVDSDDSGEILSISKLIKDQLAHCVEVFETTSFEIAENEKMFTNLDVTSMSNDINRFGGVSAVVDPSGCFIDTELAVPMATVGKERKFTSTIAVEQSMEPLFASQDNDHNDKDGASPEEEPNIYFKPIVTLLKNYQYESKEKGDVVFNEQAKLFRFDNGQWKERGVGYMKVIKYLETGQTRLLMRRDQILKVCCNHYITPEMTIDVHMGNPKALWWFCEADYSEETVKPQKLAIRFKLQVTAQKFKELFVAAATKENKNLTQEEETLFLSNSKKL